MRVLGTKGESSARVTSALDRRAVSPAPWLAVPADLFDGSVFAGLLESLLPLMGLTRVCEFEEGVLGTCHSLLSVGERLRLFLTPSLQFASQQDPMEHAAAARSLEMLDTVGSSHSCPSSSQCVPSGTSVLTPAGSSDGQNKSLSCRSLRHILETAWGKESPWSLAEEMLGGGQADRHPWAGGERSCRLTTGS